MNEYENENENEYNHEREMQLLIFHHIRIRNVLSFKKYLLTTNSPIHFSELKEQNKTKIITVGQ